MRARPDLTCGCGGLKVSSSLSRSKEGGDAGSEVTPFLQNPPSFSISSPLLSSSPSPNQSLQCPKPTAHSSISLPPPTKKSSSRRRSPAPLQTLLDSPSPCGARRCFFSWIFFPGLSVRWIPFLFVASFWKAPSRFPRIRRASIWIV